MSSGLLTISITIMTYNGKELAALIKLGIAMAQADGHVDKIEQIAIASELKNFGVNDANAPSLLAAAAIMNVSDAFGTVTAMDDEQKKYACGYLAAIMVADGEIADSEVKLWQLVCTLGSFPTMNISEALTFWTNH
uniref:Co-chaperone DjlA N-terminal domain-containing protein n=1 Tax=Prevotella sp. GTC17254 TaxID=3236794 RepID=A0AB33ISH1_9BACT